MSLIGGSIGDIGVTQLVFNQAQVLLLHTHIVLVAQTTANHQSTQVGYAANNDASSAKYHLSLWLDVQFFHTHIAFLFIIVCYV